MRTGSRLSSHHNIAVSFPNRKRKLCVWLFGPPASDTFLYSRQWAPDRGRKKGLRLPEDLVDNGTSAARAPGEDGGRRVEGQWRVRVEEAEEALWEWRGVRGWERRRPGSRGHEGRSGAGREKGWRAEGRHRTGQGQCTSDSMKEGEGQRECTPTNSSNTFHCIQRHYNLRTEKKTKKNTPAERLKSGESTLGEYKDYINE